MCKCSLLNVSFVSVCNCKGFGFAPVYMCLYLQSLVNGSTEMALTEQAPYYNGLVIHRFEEVGE